MFKKRENEPIFEWAMLGQIDTGRPNLAFHDARRRLPPDAVTLRGCAHQGAWWRGGSRFLRCREARRKAFLREPHHQA